jgi:excisionase family DNA binding protein
MKIADPPSGRNAPAGHDAPPTEGLLTSQEACRYLRVSLRWLQSATAAGHVRCVRLAHPGTQRGPVRYRRDDLDAYVARCQSSQRDAGGDK